MLTVQINKFSLIKPLQFFYLRNRSLLYIKGAAHLVVLRLPSFYFFSVKEGQELAFMFLSRFYFISFLKHLRYLLNRLVIVYFLRLKLKGLGYRVRRITKNLYRFYFTRTNYIYFHIPKQVLIKSRKKRFILISNNYHLLRLVFVNILLIKKLSPYNRRGFFLSTADRVVKAR